MYDSIARNNIVSDEDKGIVISESHNNTVINSGRGIDIDKDSYQNVIRDNIIIGIQDPSYALYVEEAEQNSLYSNILVNDDGQRISLDE
jgi:hypothetical protein